MSKKPHRKHRDNEPSSPQGVSGPVRAGAGKGSTAGPRAKVSPALKADSSTRQQRRSMSSLAGRMVRDVSDFSFGRSMAIGRLVVLEAMRMRVWGVIFIGLLAIVVGDLTTRHFDPIHDILPNLVRTSEITLTVLGIIVALFLSTYSLPHEMTTRTIYSLVTKPVSRLEVVSGKFLGLAMVLGLLTLGLGLPTWIYMQIRTAQVQQMARSSLEFRESEGTGLASDIEPATLRSIAERGPLAARVFLEASERLQIVSHLSSDSSIHLSGAPNHIAHWGFARLPVREIAEGRGRVMIRVAFGDATAAEPLERREVLVRILDEQGSSWAGSRVLSTDGLLELEIPAPARQLHGQMQSPFIYTGGKLWVSMSGVNNPLLIVDDESTTIEVEDQVFQASSGLRTTTSQTLGKFWISSGEKYAGLQSRTRFRNVPASLVSDGAQLQLEVTVPSAVDIARDARAFITLVNPNRPDEPQEWTFRPERRTTLLVDVSPEMLEGGAVDVFISADDPNVEVGVNEQSVRMISGWRPFGWNWLKSLTMSWLSFCVVASMGLMFSTISGWYVASLATSVMIVVAHVWQTILHNVQRYGLSFSSGHSHGHGDEASGPSVVIRLLEQVHEATFRALGALLPNLGQMDYGDLIAQGVNAPVGWLLAISYGVFWQVLLYVVAMILLAYLLFVRKEVAQQ